MQSKRKAEKNMTRRIISILLCAVLLLGVLPTTAFAEDTSSVSFSVSSTGITQTLIEPPYYAWYYGEQGEQVDTVIEGDSIPIVKDGREFFGLGGIELTKASIPADKVFLGVKINGAFIEAPTKKNSSNTVTLEGLEITPKLKTDRKFKTYTFSFIADCTKAEQCQIYVNTAWQTESQ